jgi:hypothetical protein
MRQNSRELVAAPSQSYRVSPVEVDQIQIGINMSFLRSDESQDAHYFIDQILSTRIISKVPL